MKISSATFLKSSVTTITCPPPKYPEYAFIGRSNVGKSSLINMLLNNEKLAKTSSTPGKTQTINHFLVNENWYLVDLPGYGYARVSKEDRGKWDKMLWEYLGNRENLMCMFVLVDMRLEPQSIDVKFINKLGENGIPFVIVFTKSDKISKKKMEESILNYKKTLGEMWEEFPPMMISSATTKTGKEEILSFIGDANSKFLQ